MNTQQFQDLYNKLNPQQKMAVDTIEGPVMVIAGPGTGKTQILTLRIANILRLSDIEPRNILAITFTEAGVSAMRKRLASIIGSAAYQVTISTFHTFCNNVIQHYSEEFPSIIGARSITDVDQIKIIEDLINHSHLQILKPFGAPLLYLRSVLSGISNLKREGIDPEQFAKILEEEQRAFDLTDDLYHEKGAHKGKMKGKYQDLQKRLAKNKELWILYSGYQSHLREHRLYDFNDMIVEVLHALQNNSDLLLTLQETYHYFLVDEHQDTNNAQNKILELLASFHENPNLFVVGDEKQAVFRFQGASLENFLYFKHLYASAKIISLAHNYRSTQSILDAAHDLMPHSPDLEAHSAHAQEKIGVYGFSKPVIEYYFIAKDIQKKIQSGINPREIAILYRDNKDALPIAHMLEKYGVSFLIESDQDLLQEVTIQKIIVILEAIHHFGNAEYLVPALALDILECEPLDIYKILSYSTKHRIGLYDLIASKEHIIQSGVVHVDSLHSAFERLTSWKKIFNNSPLDAALETLIRESGILKSILGSPKYLEQMRKLQTFFFHCRQLANERPGFALADLITHITTLREHHILIKQSPDHSIQGVRLMTAHRSKGLEFEYVYIANAHDGHWGNRRKIEYLKLPPRVYALLNPPDEESDDERNLFYVALTRAKKKIIISYSHQNESGKEQLQSQYIGEIKPELIEFPSITEYEKDYEQEMAIVFAPEDLSHQKEEDREYIASLFLEQGLAVTALNNYLECPWKYFFVNLLRVPKAQELPQLYGIAIHKALKLFFDAKNNQEGENNLLIAEYDKALAQLPMEEKDRGELRTKGENALSGYYLTYHTFRKRKTLNELSIRGILLDEHIKLNGQIDKLEFLDLQEHNVHVIDYKTGKPRNTKEIEEKGYKRQLIFYSLLLDRFMDGKYKMESGEIDFVEPDEKGKYKKEFFVISDEEKTELLATIRVVADEIIGLRFWDRRCDNPQCEYCTLREYITR